MARVDNTIFTSQEYSFTVPTVQEGAIDKWESEPRAHPDFRNFPASGLSAVCFSLHQLTEDQSDLDFYSQLLQTPLFEDQDQPIVNSTLKETASGLSKPLASDRANQLADFLILE